MSTDFVNRVRVRYADCDMQGVAFNANYLVWVDDTMDRWLRAVLGPEYLTLFDYHVKKATVTWSAPARHGDELELRPRIVRFGTTSFTVGVAITSGDRAIAQAETVGVCIDSVHRPAPIPDPVRAAFG